MNIGELFPPNFSMIKAVPGAVGDSGGALGRPLLSQHQDLPGSQIENRTVRTEDLVMKYWWDPPVASRAPSGRRERPVWQSSSSPSSSSSSAVILSKFASHSTRSTQLSCLASDISLAGSRDQNDSLLWWNVSGPCSPSLDDGRFQHKSSSSGS